MPGTRDEILAAARDLLLEEGLRGVTMRRVAERVGVSATAIYRHYADKEALLGAAVAEGGQQLGQAFGLVMRGQGARERLRETGRAYLRFAFDQPRYYQLLFMAWEDLPESSSPRSPRSPSPRSPSPRDPPQHGAALQFLFERVEECRAAGLLRPQDEALEVVMLCWSVVHGLASLWLAGGGKGRMTELEYRRLSDAVLDRALDGMLVRC
jgi:AcrR family transcriptional regulator